MTNSEIRRRALKVLLHSPKTYWLYIALLIAAAYGIEEFCQTLPFSATAAGMGALSVLDLLLSPFVFVGPACLAYRLWRGEYTGKLLPAGYFAALLISLPAWFMELPQSLMSILRQISAIDPAILFIIGMLLCGLALVFIVVDLRLALVPYLHAQQPERSLWSLCRESWRRMEGKLWRLFVITLPPYLIMVAAVLLLAIPGTLLQLSGLYFAAMALEIIVAACFVSPYIQLILAGFADETLEGRLDESDPADSAAPEQLPAGTDDPPAQN